MQEILNEYKFDFVPVLNQRNPHHFLLPLLFILKKVRKMKGFNCLSLRLSF